MLYSFAMKPLITIQSQVKQQPSWGKWRRKPLIPIGSFYLALFRLKLKPVEYNRHRIQNVLNVIDDYDEALNFLR